MLDEQINRLVDEIDSVKAKIEKSKTSLRTSEDRTRGSLIDPMLQALGWDTGDSSQVYRQYPIGGGKVDYALIGVDQKPVAIMEAKALNKSLDKDPRDQLDGYAKNIKRGLSVLTNGDKWELYDNSRRGKFNQRLILKVSIAEDPSLACAVPLLQLWRQYLVSDQPTPNAVPRSEPRPTRPATAAPSQPRPPVPGGWKNLGELEIAKKNALLPTKMRLPDGVEKPINKWSDILFEVAEWLIRDRKLTKAKCPIPLGRSELNCLVNSRSTHTNGRPLRNPRELKNGLFLNVDMNPTKLVRRSRELMEYFLEHPTSVHVQVG